MNHSNVTHTRVTRGGLYPSGVFLPTTLNADILAEALTQVPVGGTLGYEELATLVGMNARSDAFKGLLYRVRRRVLRDQRMVFVGLRGRGVVRRLSDAETVDHARTYVGKIRRDARRGAAVVTAVRDFASLSDARKLSHNAQLSVFAAIETVASGRSLERLEPSTKVKPLPLADTLRALAEMASGEPLKT